LTAPTRSFVGEPRQFRPSGVPTSADRRTGRVRERRDLLRHPWGDRRPSRLRSGSSFPTENTGSSSPSWTDEGARSVERAPSRPAAPTSESGTAQFVQRPSFGALVGAGPISDCSRTSRRRMQDR
jgi:hypothetical protein